MIGLVSIATLELPVFPWWAIKLGRLLFSPCSTEDHSICFDHEVVSFAEKDYSLVPWEPSIL